MHENWKAMLKRLKLESIRQKSPCFYEASGGSTMSIKPYTDKTSAGLTTAIIDFLTFKGFFANRINTQGQPRVNNIPRYSLLSGKVEHTQKVTWTKSNTRKGTPDIDAIIKGKAVKIEVKIGADSMSGEQLSEKLKIEAAGGLYYVATDMPSFLTWLDQTFAIHPEDSDNLKLNS